MGSLRVGHDWVTSLSLFTFMHWRRKWQPTPVFLLVESQGRGSLVAAIYGVAQSQTRLKRLSSSSSSKPHKCRKIERYFVYFLHIFGIFWCRLHTDWSLGEHFLRSRLTDLDVTSSGGRSLVIPSRIALCPRPSSASARPAYFFQHIPHYLAFCMYSCSFICLYVCLTSPTGTFPPWRRRIYLSYSSLYPNVKDSASHRVGAQ